MRDVAVTDGDRVEAQRTLGWSIQAHGDQRPRRRCRARLRADGRTRSSPTTSSATRSRPSCAPAASGTRSLRDAARIEAGLRSFLDRGRFAAFTTNFQDLGALKQLPGIAPQRLMADGYGFGAEGDWKTAALLRVLKVMGSRPGGTSFMEDYTYHFGPGEPLILGAHMLEICPTITSASNRAREIHPLGIGDREDPVRLVFDADPGPGFVVGILDLGDRFRLVANTIELVPPPRPLPKLPVARATWKPAPSLSTSAECWITAGGPHHTVLTTQVERESLEDLATIAGRRARMDRRGNNKPRVHAGARVERRLSTTWCADERRGATRARDRLRHPLRACPGARPRAPAPNSRRSMCPTCTARSRTRCPAAVVRLEPDWALQHPLDYLDVVEHGIPQALTQAGADPGRVIGIGVDFTSCTVLPTTDDGTPLCLEDEWRARPHAWPKLWKHHAAQAQADRLTAARRRSATSRSSHATAGGSRPSGTSRSCSRSTRRTARSTTPQRSSSRRPTGSSGN